MTITLKQQKKVTDFCDAISWAFDLANYTRTYKFKEDPKDTDDDNTETCADIITSHTYRTISIRIFPPFWTQSIDEQVRILIHELSHTITEDLYDCSNNLRQGVLVTDMELTHYRERATEQIATIIFRLGRNNMKYIGDAMDKYLNSDKVILKRVKKELTGKKK